MNIVHDETTNRDFFINARGQRLYVRQQPPAGPGPVRAILVAVHGYAHNADSYLEKLALAKWHENGVHVACMSHFGHGHSDGLRVYVPDYHDLINDQGDFVHYLRQQFGGDKCPPIFLIGQSMGGGIALLATMPGGPLHKVVKGVILLSPMCKIADDMMMPTWVIYSMQWLAYIMPTAAVTPVPPTIQYCFRDPAELQRAMSDPLGYSGRPRLMTALQMYNFTLEVGKRLQDYDTPFLVCHGTDDKVTAPAASQELYAKAASKDKKILMYEGCWHALLSEPDGWAEKVAADCCQWLVERL